MNDLEIVKLYFERNEKAIKETDAKYGKLCHSIANNILNNEQDAQECVNDTYIGLWNAIPPTIPNNFTFFVCKIARNLSLKRLQMLTRQKRSATVVVSIEELAEVLPDANIAGDMSEGDIAKAISEFLRNENEDVRNVFMRKYYFFDSISDIAKRYAFTESKVKSMLYHTRIKLKEYLIKEGIEI